jgi:hypothetical protein
MSARPLVLAAAAAACLLAGGCSDCGGGGGATPAPSASSTSAPAASASASAAAAEERPPWLGISTPTAEVAKVLNPKGQPAYVGPTATLRGKVTIEGDTPPPTTLAIPAECAAAQETYGRLFRVGPDGALADALVAVTGYDAFVPPSKPVAAVTIRGCAYDRRTVFMTYGQRLEVENDDAVASYMPYLDGSPFEAIRVAVPRGAPIPLSPLAPGQYLLRDAMKRPFMLADVFVLKYATADVTGTDGRYAIEGLPVGKARVDALLPVIRKTSGKEIELKEGENTLDLVLRYDAKTDRPAPVPDPVWGTRRPAPTAAPSASAAPSAPPAAP